jgi:hypothetical protein
MFSYYGSKTNIVDLYPKPVHGKIIEPFAGAAKYSLRYFDREVLIVDKYPVIIEIWQHLQKCSIKDILNLPDQLLPGETWEDYKLLSTTERYLMGFLLGRADERPRNKTTVRTLRRPKAIQSRKKFIANNLFKIRHWEIRLGSYNEVPNEIATWFVDPPYQFGGEVYVMNNKKINYTDLSSWCKERNGQLIVCENTKASWLPFIPIKRVRGSHHKTTEAIYCNAATAYDFQQQLLF